MKHQFRIVSAFYAALVATAGCKPPAPPAEKKLSDSCAIASLLALKAIQGDPYIPEAGSGLVSRVTQEKIDAADVAAVSPDERNIAKALSLVYDGRLFLNGRQDRSRLEQKTAGYGDETSGLKAEREETARQVDVFGRMFDGCVSDFDASLRSRSLAVPASCGTLPQQKQQLEAHWQQLESGLEAQRKEKSKQATDRVRREQREHALRLCDQNDKDLKDPNKIAGRKYQEERQKECEDVRAGKQNNLK